MRGDSNTIGLLLKALAYFFSLEKDLSIHVYVFSDVLKETNENEPTDNCNKKYAKRYCQNR